MHRIARWIALGLLIAGLPAQRLVKDIAVEPPGRDAAGSRPGWLGTAHGAAWFWATGHADAVHAWVSDGTEQGTRIAVPIGWGEVVPLAAPTVVGFGADGTVWTSDGTPASTRAVRRFRVPVGGGRRVGDRVLFVADDGVHGFEPWVTDGTEAGTTLLLDVRAGVLSSAPSRAFSLGSRAMFVADDGIHGAEAWVTDGTRGGTRVVDIRPGPYGSLSGSSQVSFVHAIDRVYFATSDGVHGVEPWVCDGTVAGTRLLADINPGSGSSVGFGSFRRNEIAWGKQLVFQAFDTTAGAEPWISDGTPAGTRRVVDLWPGGSSSAPRQFFAFGDRFCFTAVQPNVGYELWISDGTAAGTALLADVFPGSASSNPTAVVLDGLLAGGRALFQADDGVHGQELWVTDGTPHGTRLLADVTPGTGSSPTIAQAWSLGGRALFGATNLVAGAEPWITDGTPAGTQVLRDIRPGTGSSIAPSGFVAVHAGRKLLFAADDGEHGTEPWVTDGTPAGTALLRDIHPAEVAGSNLWYPGTLLERLVFYARELATGGEPWISDGTTAGTMLLRDFVPGPEWSTFRDWLEAADRLWFAGTDPDHGLEPWISDGTPQGTRMLRDIAAGKADGVQDSRMYGVGRLVFFEADDTQHGRELWASDGTTAGTRLVADVRPGPAGSDIASRNAFRPVALGDRLLLFSANDGVHGQEPWISDGTPNGTVLLKDLRPGSGHGLLGPDAYELITIGAHALFVGFDATAGYDLFATDGTPAGTKLLADMDPYLTDVVPVGRFEDGRVLLNSAKGIWVTDGTPTGTRRLTSGHHFGAAAIGHRVVFSRYEAEASALWVTDGTAAGTHELIEVRVIPGFPDPLVRSGDLVFFSADDGVHGVEPWVTDGTTQGTRMLVDVCRGIWGSASSVVAAGDHRRVLFLATSIEHGAEMWVSDGTTAGTQLLSDLEPGPDGSYPRYLGRAGDVLYFSCLTSRYGRELYAVDLRTVAAAYSAPLGTGCAGTDARIPRLTAVGAPRIGSSGFGATLSRARALAPAALMVGRGPGPQALAGPCSFYLGPHPAQFHTTITDGNGRSVITLGVPSTASLVGTKLHAQALVLDPNGAWMNLASFSNGLTIVVGR